MSLIVSISGIRGTIGGRPGENLTPVEIIKFSSAYGTLLKEKYINPKIALGRDGRISGEMVSNLVISTLQAIGVSIVDLGLSTTPTVEMFVIQNQLEGGIILTASHNPKEWNALKLLNDRGEFLSEEDGRRIVLFSEQSNISFAEIDVLGKIIKDPNAISKHIEAILALPIIPWSEIRRKKFHVIADCINSTGALALPILFEALDCSYELLNADIHGNFSHNPEPLPEHLEDLIYACGRGVNLGIAVDPDVDRLALVDEKGNYFGEEYSLVAAADYILGQKQGNSVSNLSSSRALKDLTLLKGGQYYASPVGEVHVVKKMKEVNAVIGGEGNGGIILPQLHYGRDALVGVALILSHLTKSGKSLSELRAGYPTYEMCKDKIQLNSSINYLELINYLIEHYKIHQINIEDGLKIDFEHEWVHLRKSNTEPIIRIYSEATSFDKARNLVDHIKELITNFKN
ncbi:MAG: phosphoglucosamine mutase [Bacteroidota bacterium]|nr:phosphoglucosamine mutase [Bacteroidota bacterium]